MVFVAFYEIYDTKFYGIFNQKINRRKNERIVQALLWWFQCKWSTHSNRFMTIIGLNEIILNV